MGTPKKSPRRRTLKSITAAIAVGAAMFLAGNVPPAFAVHDNTFQLDGDVLASTTTTVGGTTQTVDWDSIFTAAGANKNPLPTGFTAAVFDNDFTTNANGSFNTSDATTFTQGSKDTLPISGWSCTFSSNVNSKIDVMNSYTTAYTAPNGDQILYFALERNANTGDANVAFWFLQDKNVGCNDNGGTAAFTGQHVDGDLLIVSAFTNGGVVSNIDAYRWNGGANGSLNPTPVASAHGADCKTTGAGDNACATVNTGTITTPWSTSNKQDGVGHSLRSTEFFEGGLNLTKTGLGGKCFNTFMADTRSSQSLTATLFDFSLGTLGECTSSIVTTPSISAPVTIPASGTISGVTDSALLKVDGISTFNGTITWSICGPLGLATTSNCFSGGSQVGSPTTVTAQGTYVSPPIQVTSAGRYCWRAEFSGDVNAGVPGSADPGIDPATGLPSTSTSECFVVNPRQTTLSTQAGASPVDFGQPVTDTATLGNTANRPGSGGIGSDGSINPTTPGGPAGGKITFTLFKADCSTLATGTGTNPQDFTAISGDGTYGPVSFTPDAPGTYHWVAVYSGDSPNTLKSDHNLTCNDTNEDVVVRQIPTAISTAQRAYPNDSATISSTIAGNNLPGTGTVVFSLYNSLANCQAGGTTGRLYTETQNNVGGQNSVTVSTSNTNVAVNTNTTVFWKVTYAPGDQAHTGRQSNCTENTVFAFNNDSGPGTLFP
ncbi:hypothetical protein GCM10027053_21740 [Intrasporangium mesophilum]